MKSGTVKELFDHYKGSAPGFDALRLILSVMVLLWHTVYLYIGGPAGNNYLGVAHHPALMLFLRPVLPSFFFLGGFLVTGSAYRLKSVTKFLIFRALRIVPALLVEVVLSAFILGAAVTTLPLGDYFTDPGFFKYFLNAVGYIHFRLPGVFDDQLVKAVNINLWTLPPDLDGYGIMAVLVASGIVFNRRAYLSVFLMASAFLVLFLPLRLGWGMGNGNSLTVISYLWIYSFFLGATAYVLADRIRLTPKFLALGLAGLLFFECPYTVFLGVLSACYVTLCIGFMDLRKFPLIKRGDYSYGLYLYGFPIQQALRHYFPALQEWWALALVSLPLALIFAAVSWHCVEEPMRALKRRIPYLNKRP